MNVWKVALQPYLPCVDDPLGGTPEIDLAPSSNSHHPKWDPVATLIELGYLEEWEVR